MMTRDLVPSDSLTDEGPLSAADSPLARRFRLWRGPDGRRQVFSVYAAEDAPDYPDAVAIAVRHVGGRRVPLWTGPAGIKARVAARAVGAQEIHLRILPETVSGPLAPL
ncbi:hypothetical protein FHS55_001494 [Angulomicrobium tetraedrale]|uniref:Uncharacterized protein n=1 Tax=Ancylobacter tetraedralis TaxID=217068 RepID=A0A839Z5G4_9HYPH|nr:hypothetical protein [Ancylobacter tetraedralis]MBB3770899.1 hypothetical protein [Ancylobacter tetraedralis]